MASVEQRDAVLVESRDSVGVLTLNRPDKFNCLSTELLDGLSAGLDHCEDDANIRVVLIKAAGKHFCTGADLSEVLEARKSEESLREFIEHLHRVLNRFEASCLPVVGSVHGLALAGGLELMLACDVVFAASDAKLGDQHAQFGLVPGGGGSQRLPRLVGLRRALEIMYSARWLDAAEAERIGLVNSVVEPYSLDTETMSFCRQLCERSRAGIAAMKRLARDGMSLGLADGLTLERREVVAALQGDDVSEGLAAFAERRAPTFK